MARPLHHLHLPSSNPTLLPLLIVIATVAATASIITTLCTTNKHSKKIKHKPLMPSSDPSQHSLSNDRQRKLVSTLSGIGSKAMVVAKMVSWKREKDGDGDEDREAVEESESESESEAVWRKSILMGGKCRPIQFSGQIVYDKEGKEVRRKEEEEVGGGKVEGSSVS